MNLIMKLAITAAIILTTGLSAPAAVYNVNGNTTAIQKVNAYFVNTFFTPSTSSNYVKIADAYTGGSYYPSYGSVPYYSNRESYMWTAPAGETIAKINFFETYILGSGDAAAFMPVIYNLSGGALMSASSIVWTSPATSGTSSVAREVTLPAGITSVGFGFSTSQWPGANLPVTYGSSVQFSDIVVTTPEPASLTLLAMAGALVLTRKRR